ncbi:MFS general substrate transporter [Phellopilus nigrolimitatus]|nr:MFS general substrate transporter [Phellopilus nigrolimitatus]
MEVSSQDRLRGDSDTDCERTPLLSSNDRHQYEANDWQATSRPCSTENSVASSRESERLAPFAWGPLMSILSMALVQPLCFELIFPFINQMIVENGIVDDPEQVGFYSGFIESVFQVMSFLAVMPCSFMSDRLGRKPVVLAGTAGMALSITLFGVSKSYWMMIATRCIGGTLGGTMSALKVMMAEIYTEKAHRASAFSIYQIAFRIGQITGQPLGGLLSHPARNIPIFDTPFWRKYPFSLPCLIASAIAISSAVWAYFTLEEASLSNRHCAQSIETNIFEDNLEAEVELASNERVSVTSVLTPHVISVLVSIFIMTIVSETIFALYPLFAFTPITSGGLGLSEAQIGAHMAIRSAFNIIVMCFYVPFASRLGAVRLYQVGMSLWPLAMACFPLLNALARTKSTSVGTWTFDAAAGVFFMLWSLGNLVWPSSQIVVIEAPPSPEALAVVNGLAQMVQTFTMAIAPAFVTSLFAFSVNNHVIGGNLVYVVMLAMSCVGALHCLTLREPVLQ